MHSRGPGSPLPLQVVEQHGALVIHGQGAAHGLYLLQGHVGQALGGHICRRQHLLPLCGGQTLVRLRSDQVGQSSSSHTAAHTQPCSPPCTQPW
jgi:hypothetical protein